MRKIYTSVDLGSNSIKIVVGEIIHDKLNILASTSIKSNGIKKGLIVNAIDSVSSLREALKSIEEKLGIRINKVITSIPSYYATFDVVTGECDVSGDMIDGEDIVNVLKTSVSGKIKEDKELVSIIPIYFSVDDKKNIKDPKGLVASKIGVKAMMVCVPKKCVQSVISLFNSIGISVLDVNLGAVADYYECVNDKIKDKLSLIVNIGHDVTTVSIFNKGIIINSEVIPLGSKNITNDLSYIYKISPRESTKLKENFAVASKKYSLVNDVKEVITENKDLIKITQYDASLAVMSRLTEILKLAKKQSYLLTNREISYIIVTGGGSEIPAMNHLVEDLYGLDASVHTMEIIGIRSNIYSVASGLIKSFDKKLNLRDRKLSMINFEESDEENINNTRVLDRVVNYLFDD